MELSDSQRYLIPSIRHQVEEEIRRSRFISTIDYAPTVESARELIDSVASAHPDASHNCWAYVVGPPGSTAQIGMSDAGEPHGTAGRPMLTVLLNSNVGDICAVVTRYFGGTLLGKGGLVKAYTGGVQLALQSLPTRELISTSTLRATLEYTHITMFKRLVPSFEATVTEESYAAEATFTVEVPDEYLAGLIEAITDLTSGKVHIEHL